MSKAFKCDRCGQCFYPGDAEYIKARDLMFIAGNIYSERHEEFELCLECSADFKQFLKEKVRA